MFVAIREIRRSIGRFGLLTGAVALLVVLLLFFQAVAGSLTLGLTGGIENNSADVLVYSDRARSNPAASFLPPGTGSTVEAIDGVAEVSEVGRVAVNTAAGDAAAGDPAAEDIVVVGLGNPSFGGPASLSAGRLAEAPGEAVVSSSSLSTGFELGATVTTEGVDLTVVGAADDAAFDVSPTFYVLFDDYATIVANRAGSDIQAPISWVAVRSADGVDPVDLAARVTTELGAGFEALDRDTAAAELPGVGQVTQSFGILYLLLFIVVTIVTGVFFLILTVQKQRSLVLFRAIGAGRLDVVKPVLIQVLFVVGFGCLLGVAVAAALLSAARDTFGSALDPRTTVLTVGFLIFLGVLASFGAVRRVLAIDPIEATTSGTI